MDLHLPRGLVPPDASQELDAPKKGLISAGSSGSNPDTFRVRIEALPVHGRHARA